MKTYIVAVEFVVIASGKNEADAAATAMLDAIESTLERYDIHVGAQQSPAELGTPLPG